MVNRHSLLAGAVGQLHRGVWPLCVAVLLLCDGLLIWKTRQMGDELDRARHMVSAQAFHEIMMEPLQDSRGGTTMLHHSCGRYLALVVFARYEGPFYTNEVSGLNRVVQRRPDVAVFGLAAYGKPDEVREFISQQQISYPVLIDTDGSVVRGLGLPETPWNFIFDCSGHRLVYQGPSVANGHEGQEFATKLLSLGK
jgi:peroxiredoxin